jgi:hypothetical protein
MAKQENKIPASALDVGNQNLINNNPARDVQDQRPVDRDQWLQYARPDPTRQFLHKLPSQYEKPGYRQKLVNPNLYPSIAHAYQLQKYKDAGWDFIYGMGQVLAGRNDVVRSEANIHDDIFVVNSIDGRTKMYWMEIPEVKFNENQAKKLKLELERMNRSISRVSKTGRRVQIEENDFRPLGD